MNNTTVSGQRLALPPDCLVAAGEADDDQIKTWRRANPGSVL